MAHRPLQFKPVPQGAVGARSLAPSTTRAATAVEVTAPTNVDPIEKKPTVRRKPNPQPRRLTDEPAVSMGSWNVDPGRIANDLGMN